MKMLVFEERGKPEYLEKNLSEKRREPTTTSTHIWHRHQEPGPHWWEASALTSAPSFALQLSRGQIPYPIKKFGVLPNPVA